MPCEAAAETPLDERGSLIERYGDFTWDACGEADSCASAVAPEGSERSIAVGSGRFRMDGVIVWVKTRAMNCVGGDGGSPWRGEPRGNETEQE